MPTEKVVLDKESKGKSKQERKLNFERTEDVIRDILKSDPYKKIDEIRKKENASDRQVKIHRAKAKELQEKGEIVISFNNAGSKHRFPYMNHIVPQKGREFALNNKYTGGKEERFIRDTVEHIKLKADAMGSPMMVGGKIHSNIRNKIINPQGVKREKITMSGPLPLKGVFDRGTYSIHNLRNYIYMTGKERILEEIRKNPNATTPIHLTFRGHSRGGVATIQGAMMLKYFLNDFANNGLTKEQAARFKFHVMQFDPVPGPGHSGVYEEVNYDSRALTPEMMDKKMLPLGYDTESTVVYSLHTEHSAGFHPQVVHGAKRVIVQVSKHSTGLEEVEETKSAGTNGELKSSGKHHKSYIDAQTGEVHRMSGLEDLKEGLYVADQSNVLIRFDDPKKFKEFVNRMTRSTIMQSERHKRLIEVGNAFFKEQMQRRMENANPYNQVSLWSFAHNLDLLEKKLKNTVFWNNYKTQFSELLTSVHATLEAAEEASYTGNPDKVKAFKENLKTLMEKNDNYINHKLPEKDKNITGYNRVQIATELKAEMDLLSRRFAKFDAPDKKIPEYSETVETVNVLNKKADANTRNLISGKMMSAKLQAASNIALITKLPKQLNGLSSALERLKDVRQSDQDFMMGMKLVKSLLDASVKVNKNMLDDKSKAFITKMNNISEEYFKNVDACKKEIASSIAVAPARTENKGQKLL